MLEELKGRLAILQAVVGSEETAARVSIAAASAVIPEYKTRIFTEGLTTNGSPIGQYSTKPFYQNPNALPGVSTSGIIPEGKYGQKVFKNGKNHKTKYLSGGYSELRQLTGRQNSTVDLNFSGALERSILVVVEGNTAFIRYTNDFEAEKMVQNERRFGAEISTVSEQERELGNTAAAIELREILDDII